MLTQQQNTLHSPEEETAPPLDQMQPSAPTSSWRGWSLWLRVVGVVVSLVCGLAIGAILSNGWALLIFFLVGMVSAYLLRSWWAMLIVPAVFSVGAILGAAIAVGGFDKLFTEISVNADAFFVFGVLCGVVPVVLGAIIGGVIGVVWKKRWR